jgi:nucleoside-diphosphate-sugar epimerase
VQFVRGDICDPQVVEDAIAGQDVVFHSASLVHTKHNRLETVRAVNIDGTRNVLRACQQHAVPRLVYVSSASVVYDGHDIENGDESLPYAPSFPAPYAETKRIAEEEVLKANGQHGVLTCAIRPHVVFGPGDTRLLPAILSRAREGKLKFRVGLGEKKLSDFTYVTNVVDAMLAADLRLVPDSPVPGQAYFITNGEPMSFWDFVAQVLPPLGYQPPQAGDPPRDRLRRRRRARGLRHLRPRRHPQRRGGPVPLRHPLHLQPPLLQPRPRHPRARLRPARAHGRGHRQRDRLQPRTRPRRQVARGTRARAPLASPRGVV